MFFETNTSLRTVWKASPVVNQSFKTIWTTSSLEQKCKRETVKRSHPIYTWGNKQTNKKIHHHQLKRLVKLKSITRSAWPNTFHYINTKLVWHRAFIFNFSVNNKMRAGIPSTFQVQTFHLVTTSITHWRGVNIPCNFSDQQLYSPTKYFPSRFLTRSVSKTSNSKCLKTCLPALMCLLY